MSSRKNHTARHRKDPVRKVPVGKGALAVAIAGGALAATFSGATAANAAEGPAQAPEGNLFDFKGSFTNQFEGDPVQHFRIDPDDHAALLSSGDEWARKLSNSDWNKVFEGETNGRGLEIYNQLNKNILPPTKSESFPILGLAKDYRESVLKDVPQGSLDRQGFDESYRGFDYDDVKWKGWTKTSDQKDPSLDQKIPTSPEGYPKWVGDQAETLVPSNTPREAEKASLDIKNNQGEINFAKPPRELVNDLSLINPVGDAKRTQLFGGTEARANPNYWNSPTRPSGDDGLIIPAIHNGIDYKLPAGSPVLSAGDGRVKNVGSEDFTGRNVTIDHGKGISSNYLHLDKKVSISEGDKVRRGQPIGSVGKWPVDGGDHFHFNIQNRGTSVNPQNFLPFVSSPASKNTSTATGVSEAGTGDPGFGGSPSSSSSGSFGGSDW